MTSQPTLNWNPERTWLFVVGILEWQDADSFSPFPKQNRRDAALVEFFRSAGVPADQISYLQDHEATTPRIQRELKAQLARTRADDMLVLYFCGHGYKTDDGVPYFASYNAGVKDDLGWLVEHIPSMITRHFVGKRALLLADCCYSGCLADAVAQHESEIAFACLTSSLSSESSTGNWTFTEGLLIGLRGLAFVDTDASNTISLGELAEQIAESMAFAEEQIVTFTTTKGFNASMVMAAARPRSDTRIGQRLEVESDGEWYRAQIIDARGDEVLVHYYGYEQSDDEWVTADRLREVVYTLYPVGSSVEVKWKRKWYPAKILDVHAGIHKIHYEDYGSDWDEWVSAKRIRQT